MRNLHNNKRHNLWFRTLCLLATRFFLLFYSVSVVGPRILRPHNPYTVVVAAGSKPQSLYVAVEGRKSNGEQYTQGREVQVQPGLSRILDLEVSTIFYFRILKGRGRVDLYIRLIYSQYFHKSGAA